MLWLIYTPSKPPSMATLAHTLACPDCVFHFSATTDNGKKWSGQARLYLAGQFLLAMSYLAVYHH